MRGDGHTGDFVEMAGDQHEITESDRKEYFAQIGMTWPEGSSIKAAANSALTGAVHPRRSMIMKNAKREFITEKHDRPG